MTPEDRQRERNRLWMARSRAARKKARQCIVCGAQVKLPARPRKGKRLPGRPRIGTYCDRCLAIRRGEDGRILDIEAKLAAAFDDILG